ncbi:gluconokinase [Nostoc sp. FACHB-152]|uniref:gluconokinase n=1 Tax=unclassified Nostoc TaxID=2593658 RepID=UPI00168656B8|nr:MULTISPECIES: gluconokinase [unclassified Nostoc]MBD2448111.1 gluconokinase [Nostoc sp. FACHB-152]MBD2467141.1 gluconokinase [Nostoc sp. FACHB-145]
MIVIVMGVAGSGKTTVGQALAAATGWEFSDADLFHSAIALAKMARGEPLTDADRTPWLQTMQSAIARWLQEDKNVILACSALKSTYRQILGGDDPRVKFIYLKGSYELIQQRLRDRVGHFMKADLLPSQFDTLEEPTATQAFYVDISQNLEEIIDDITTFLNV